MFDINWFEWFDQCDMLFICDLCFVYKKVLESHVNKFYKSLKKFESFFKKVYSPMFPCALLPICMTKKNHSNKFKKV